MRNMRHLCGLFLTILAVAVLPVGAPVPASAAPDPNTGEGVTTSPPTQQTNHGLTDLLLEAQKRRQNQIRKVGGSGGASASLDRRLRAQAKAVDKYMNHRKLADAYEKCLRGENTATCKSPGPAPPLPGLIAIGHMDGPQFTPEQAATVAIARLRLSPPQVGFGPSPDINDWHIAAVGYPYWLWADGNLHPAASTTTVADLTVHLDAHLAKVTFDLGDGTRTTCTNLTTRWDRSVTPGAPSPVCGHTYTTPSLPQGKYTITAYSTWDVNWSVNGVGGTIPLYQQSQTTVPVGELQVLTR